MAANLIDGRSVAEDVYQEVRGEVEALSARGIRPGLVAVRVGNDPASELYVRNKAAKAEELGLAARELHLDESVSEEELVAAVEALNRDDAVDGILVQLPLPKQIRASRVIETIDPAKDVDGFHPASVGRLHLGQETLVPCTPAGVIRLIESTGTTIEGAEAVVIGRSDIVGKPVASLLLQRNATTTVCHSRTRNLAAVIRRADIVIAAVGRPLMVTREMVRDGAVVIDVGINRLETGTELAERLDERKREALARRGSVVVGDVDFAAVREIASWITPVPGGVGPMTIAMLMLNTVRAARERRG